jgi:hypothetical protein
MFERTSLVVLSNHVNSGVQENCDKISLPKVLASSDLEPTQWHLVREVENLANPAGGIIFNPVGARGPPAKARANSFGMSFLLQV